MRIPRHGLTIAMFGGFISVISLLVSTTSFGQTPLTVDVLSNPTVTAGTRNSMQNPLSVSGGSGSYLFFITSVSSSTGLTNVQFENSNTFQFFADLVGSYTINVTVSDYFYPQLSATAAVSVVVEADSNPLFLSELSQTSTFPYPYDISVYLGLMNPPPGTDLAPDGTIIEPVVPITFSVVGGSLPPGWLINFDYLNPTQGRTDIRGPGNATPDVYVFTIKATDANGRTGTKTYTFTIGCGDERDEIIAEYVKNGVRFYADPQSPAPRCTDFTSIGHTEIYSFQDLMLPGDDYESYGLGILGDALVAPASSGHGLDLWVSILDESSVRPINSAYRNPAHNASVGGAPQGRHQWGDAVDLRNYSNTLKEYLLLANAARAARASWIEEPVAPYTCRPGKGNCVHADWRYLTSSYVHP